MPADWEPAPPSARLENAAWRLEVLEKVLRDRVFDAVLPTRVRFAADMIAADVEEIRKASHDVAAMERRLAEYARKERADAE